MHSLRFRHFHTQFMRKGETEAAGAVGFVLAKHFAGGLSTSFAMDVDALAETRSVARGGGVLVERDEAMFSFFAVCLHSRRARETRFWLPWPFVEETIPCFENH
jgi:hypothetical protein